MTEATATTATQRCAACSAPFRCGRHDAAPCWCAALPALPAERIAPGGCLCPACLQRRLEAAA